MVVSVLLDTLNDIKGFFFYILSFYAYIVLLVTFLSHRSRNISLELVAEFSNFSLVLFLIN